MAEMNTVLPEGHTDPHMEQVAGGVERLQQIPPQPVEAPCLPVPCPPVNPNAPMGPAVAVHEPAAGQHTVVTVVSNQPLVFDFNPLDLRATQHDGDVTLVFPDGGQVVLHEIVGPCGPQPTPFQLPDGTVITPSELLHAFNMEALPPCGITPVHHPHPPAIIENTGAPVPTFEVEELGSGLYGLGPLGLNGFGYGAEFPHGVWGGVPPTPPGPPSSPPPPPPPSHFLTVPDLDPHSYFLGVSTPAPVNVGGTNYTITQTGNYIAETPVTSSPAAFITDYWTPGTPMPSHGTHASPGAPLAGQFGTFTMDAAGNYSYTLSAASEHTLSQLGTDWLSQSVNQPTVGAGFFQPGFQDVFEVAVSNGFDSHGVANNDIKEILFDYWAANVTSTPATVAGTSNVPGNTTQMLLTYTDLVDPAHSFQQLVNIDALGNITVTPESTTSVQPNDPALVSLEYVSGGPANINTITLEGQTINFGGGVTLDSNFSHAAVAVINPALDGLGDPGDTGNVSTVGLSQDIFPTLLATTAYADALSGQNGQFGYLYVDNGTTATGGGNADIINFAVNGSAAGITLNGSSVANSTNVFEWSSNALISNTVGNTPGIVIDGVSHGLNVLEIESPTSQTLNFSSTLSSDPTTGNVRNIEVFDLTDGAHPGTSNSITLSANDVFNLAQNEPAAIQNAGGAVSLWVLGNGNDFVNLTGTGSTWTQISQQVTGVGQTGGSPSQMVGFTEYAATTSGGQAVHVYVQNAIQAAAGHVSHA